MHSPIREQVRLENPWQAELLGANRARIFIPAPWQGKQVRLLPAPGVTWSAVWLDQSELPFAHEGDAGFQLPADIACGVWHELAASGGSLAGARLVALEPFAILGVSAPRWQQDRLSFLVDLSAAATCTIAATLTGPNGTVVARALGQGEGGTRVQVGLGAVGRLQGTYQVKFALLVGGQVVDNARLSLRF